MSAELLKAINTEVFALDRLRAFEAADLAAAQGRALDFQANVGESLLPEIIRLAERAEIKLAFIRVQRRPAADGPPPQSPELTAYVNALKGYLEARGAYFHDDWGDPDEPLSMYADGDHLTGEGRIRYTQRFAERHAALPPVIFHSLEFAAFFIVTVTVYWRLPRAAQNVLLLVASYVFYGWVHPWWPVLLLITTVVDYWAARRIAETRTSRPQDLETWAEESVAVAQHRRQPGPAGRLQVFRFLRRQRRRRRRRGRLEHSADRVAAGPAGRHLVLHVPVDELHDRRLSRARAGADEIHRRRGVRLVLPAPGGRADHARDQPVAADRAEEDVLGRGGARCHRA